MSGQNPYEPPKVDVSADPSEPAGEELPTARQGARLLNFIIDYVMVLVVSGVVGFVMVLAFGQDSVTGLAGNVVGICVMIGYYIIFEGAFGWTVGKLITGTRVIRFDGRKPRFAQIVGRTAARFIPFEPFSLLGGGSGWHDSMSGTRVVRVRR